MNATPPTARELFAELLEQTPREEWDARLAGIRRQDPALADRVEKLLQAHLLPQSFLDKPLAPTVAFADNAAVGTQIGPYKLREQIGEGGFGVVYVAEQEHPIRRKVALKIIKPGMDSREVIARFEAERQALALMDHPNIAKVLDAGTTGRVESPGASVQGQESQVAHPSSLIAHPSSRPFFVMELVRGLPITDFCDRERLTTEQRLRLFTDVCRAVQHAHQKGVIHRDIKPTNVLVTLHDGRPIPKVIDFGVAKALSRPLTENTLYTALGQMVGTPLYMSPEQAEMSGLDVDTRSDVYSLGVLLYELLTGSTPFDKETLKKAGFDELRRIIRETEPVMPSARISTLKNDRGATISDQRRVDARRLAQSLRGDLDWIVMKALEKDRDRRYATPADLADDVLRHLGNEPVKASPPSITYLLSKHIARHRILLSTASAVLLCMVLGTGFSVWYAVQADRALQQAEQAGQLASDRLALLQAEQEKLVASEERTAENFELAKRAVGQLIDDVAQHRLAGIPEFADLRERLLLTADGFYTNLLAADPDDAGLYIARADVRGRLHRYDDRLQDLKLAAEAEPENFLPHNELAHFYRFGAPVELRDGQKALEHAQRAVEISPNPRSLDTLGWVYRHLGDHAKASEMFWRAAETAQNEGDRLGGLGNALWFDRRFVEAAEAYRQAIEHRAWGKSTSMLYYRRALSLRHVGKLDEAIECLTEAITLEMNADREKAFHLRAECHWDLRHYGKAARDWEQALELAPFTSRFVPRLFECFLREQDYVRATMFLDRRTGASEFDRLIIAENSAAMESIDPAEQSQLVAAWDRFIERVVVHLPPEDDLEQLVAVHRYAADLKSKSEPSGAMEPGPWMIVAHDGAFFSELTRLMPRDYRPWEVRARAFAVESDWDRAAADYARALELVGNSEPNDWWGRETELALRIAYWPDVLERVLTLRPDDDRLRVARARHNAAAGKLQEAADEVATLAKGNPRDQWHWYVLAILNLQTGDADGYRDACGQLLKRFSRHGYKPVQVVTARACLLAPHLMQDRLDEVEAVVNDAFSAEPPPGWAQWFNLVGGLLAYRKGDFAGAREWLEKPPKGLLPRQANVQVLLSMIDHGEGRTEQARQTYEDAVAFVAAKQIEVGATDYRRQIHEWLMADILRRQAAELLQIDEPAVPGRQPDSDTGSGETTAE